MSQQQQYTVQRRTYGPGLKLADAVCGALRAAHLPLTSLDPDSILRAARRSTGLDDWGDEGFQVPMRKLLPIVEAAPITNFGRASVRQAMVKAVSNRLQIEHYIKQHPEVERIPIERPVFILGFPRTGTTALQNLLSLGGGRRSLKFWELMTPYPLHDDPEIDRRRRRRAAAVVLRLAYLIAPEQRFIHEIKVDTAEECWPLFYNTFAAMNLDLQSALSAFGDWLMSYDMSGPYREYRRQLQLLAYQRPTGQFVLKCPEHLWFLDTILEVFPDACIVWTHRDPVASVASYSSLISLNHRLWYGGFQPEALGAYVHARFLSGVTRAMHARDRAGREAQFFDVDFRELVSDQAGMVRRICEHFDLALGPRDEAAVRAWLESKRADAKGMHSYSPEQFGLDAAAIHRDYAAYIERFRIPLGPR